MSQAFVWNDTYSVHVAAMDRQHQQLFIAINELNDALAAGHGNDVVDDVLHKLVDYAMSHFTAEEKLMERFNFPGLDAHRERHRELVAKVNKLHDEFKAGNVGVAVSLMLFLQEWLKDHIMGVDHQYSDYLTSKGVH